MIKNSIYKLTAFTLATLIFFTSVGFSIDIHSCQGSLKGISFIGEAKSCHSIKKVCPNHPDMVLEEDTKKDCCSNQTLEFEELDSDFNFSSGLAFSKRELKFITSFAYSFFIVNDKPSVTERKTFKAPAPPVTRDIYALHEAFLI